VRFVFAIVSFVVAAVLIGLGIAQNTVLAGPDALSLSTETGGTAVVTVIDGAAFNAFEGSQTIAIDSEGPVFAAYGRTTDVVAWVGNTTYSHVTFDGESGELVTTLVRGAEAAIPNPEGSDLWLDSYTRDRDLRVTVRVPQGVSFLVASDGISPAPDGIVITWPLDNSTPWAGPLINVGAIVLLLGLGFLVWATNHMRRGRGPKRKGPQVPKAPRRTLIGPRKSAPPSSATEFAALGRGRRMLWGLPVLLAGALVLSGCTSGSSISGDAPAPTPSPTGTDAPVVPEIDPPAVTVRQIDRIVGSISELAATSDADLNAETLATRFEGAALQLRTANYAIRTADPAIAALPPIPNGEIEVVLPQQTESWPRTVFVVSRDDKDATIAPVALFLVQDDPRSNYKVSYAITLEPSAVLPDVAPASVGAPALAPDNAVLKMSPDDVALAYANILENDLESPYFADFEEDGDSLRVAIGVAGKEAIRAALPTTASVTFAHSLGDEPPISLATNNAGAIIAVNLNETTTVAPVEEGAAVNPTGQVKALSGLSVTTKGVTATYGDQLLFYVPPAGSKDPIILLGYSQGLISATEIG
jgi:hypothetical protein